MLKNTKKPLVFISYSHDSSEHKNWVLKLASDLTKNGVKVILDQWSLRPGQDIVSFMHRGIALADRVLLICSEQYVEKAERGEGGVGFEKLIVSADIIARTKTKKYIPLVRGNGKRQKVPSYLGPRLYLDFNHDAEYDETLTACLKELYGIPQRQRPLLGKNPFERSEVVTQLIPREKIFPQGLGEGSGVLTARHLEVLKWIACGKSSWDIAQILRCSEATINFHCASIRRILGVSSRREAVAAAIRGGLLHVP